MDIKKINEIVRQDGIVFLTYGGFLSQTLISGMTEALEREAEHNKLNMGDSNNIFTIFIELSQNMMNYSKSKETNEFKSEGLIIVGKLEDGKYYIHSQNIITLHDKEKIEPKLNEIITLDRDQIKKFYRELRKSGKNTHGKGGGIGFYEIAKRSNEIEFSFEKISEDRYYFNFQSIVNAKKDKTNG